MCTLSWLYHGNNHYEIYFNRDEQRSRLPALEPQSVVIDGVHCLMPIDPVGGGSWISTNEHGVTVCLLNFYQGETPAGALVSRGNIIKRLASSCSSQTVDDRLLVMDLTSFAPFTVVSFDTRRTANETVLWTWDGKQLNRSHAFAPIVSAAKHFDDARHYRRELFNELVTTIASQEVGRLFHLTYDINYPHLSPLMARNDARTVSFTSVVVSSTKQEMHYQSIDNHRNVDFRTSLSCLKNSIVEQGVFK
ncbi:NRDE family protein [Vibrio brasiliensis]|uniref:NRDE family protein n=1 Tax=Vibrio brasiliensis TaxID=170652 RepID=UPI001EFC391C|nr:NRDE family protein [Vibrio brasiliensis]MCG9649099.1 NRDE family protein [Vibrio brasiliensis]